MKIYRPYEFIEQGKNIHVFVSRDRTRPEATHVHDFIEIVYMLAGKCEQTVDGRVYEASHGDLFFINYGSTHSFSSNDPISYVNICFSPEVMGDAIISRENAFALLSLTAFDEMCNGSDDAKISFFGNERKEIEDILFAMHRECRDKRTAWNGVVESYLNILITKMLRKTQTGMQSEVIGDVWQELSEYIDQNLGGDLTLEALAQKCFYNPSYFSRVFKEKFGMSFVEYVNRRRLERAVKLLTESTLSIEEIYVAVGFSSRAHFYRVFAKYVGGLPTDYREKVKKENK